MNILEILACILAIVLFISLGIGCIAPFFSKKALEINDLQDSEDDEDDEDENNS
jgi:hypothetical protein